MEKLDLYEDRAIRLILENPNKYENKFDFVKALRSKGIAIREEIGGAQREVDSNNRIKGDIGAITADGTITKLGKERFIEGVVWLDEKSVSHYTEVDYISLTKKGKEYCKQRFPNFK